MDAKPHAPKIDKISQTLSNDLNGFEQLYTLLLKERELLVNREFDDFAELLSNKNNLLLALEENNNQRVQLLAARKLPIDKQGMDQFIDSLPKENINQQRANWTRVHELIDECSKLNQINARIAHRAQSTTHQVLNILRGEPAKFALYGKKGTPAESANQLTITKA
ncbi:MAG: flagellar protein FlgN [Pseudomonadales bacterium]|nr:flagellar protein FlgN [Pseudomonadales bacterium]